MNVKVEELQVRVEETKKKKRSYLQELKDELKKVTWTNREELIFCTKLMIFSTLLFGIGIYIVDLSIKGFLNGFSRIVHLIFG